MIAFRRYGAAAYPGIPGMVRPVDAAVFHLVSPMITAHIVHNPNGETKLYFGRTKGERSEMYIPDLSLFVLR
jgi:hypothetical protein